MENPGGRPNSRARNHSRVRNRYECVGQCRPGRFLGWSGSRQQRIRQKTKGGRSTKGNVDWKTALVEAADAAARAKGAYLRKRFFRLKARRAPKGAAVVVAHKILLAANHMLSQEVWDNDLGGAYLDQLSKSKLTRNLFRRLECRGYNVTLQAAGQNTPRYQFMAGYFHGTRRQHGSRLYQEDGCSDGNSSVAGIIANTEVLYKGMGLVETNIVQYTGRRWGNFTEKP